MEHAEPHHHLKLIVWTVSVVFLIALLAVIFLVLIPKSLVVAGTLKTKDGPVKAGVYDFRLKFYNATTRTDLVYSYDAKGVTVDEEGKFSANLPDGKALNVATLMQVCIASPDSAVPGTIIGGQATLPSCEVSEEADQAAYNQTICGLTAVDQDPTNPINWLASKNVVYATPTKACGESGTGIASVSTVDVVAPLLETPGALGELLGSGVALQPGSLLSINENGEITVATPTEAVSEVVKEEIAQNEAENQTVIDTPPTGTESGINTTSQTLSLSGNVLTISGGNSVTLPSGGDGDEVIGNEITDIIPGDGLVRVGTGTTLDPFKVGLITCASGQLLKSNGTATWNCATDTDTIYTAGTGIAFAGNVINNTGVLSFTLPAGGGLTNTGTAQSVSLRLQNCGNGEILQFNGGTWVCVLPGGVSSYSFSISDGVTSEPIMNGNTVTFIGNEGLVATVSATDSITYGIVDGGVTTVKLADGSVTNTKIANGAVTTINLADGSVTNAKLANSSITVTAGSGLSGGGVATLGSGTTLNLQACANGQILKHNGTTWVCAADSDTPQTLSIVANAPDSANTVSYDLSISGGNTVNFDDRDTLYTALTGGGLALTSDAFSLQTCPVGQILKSTNAGTPAYACAADGNTTYTAGTGLSLVGTTFNNTGVLGVTASGALTSTGGQNPNIAFADGAVAGQFWQWDGDSWELATLPADGDSVVGNEVTNVTGSNSGLVRAGSGTAIDPYTLAVSTGNGIQLTSGNITINSPTCSGTDKLQWNGTAFVCSADVNTTYSADNGISLAGTTFSVNSPTCAGTTKLQWNGTAFVCSTDIDAQTLGWVDGTRTLSISNGNSVVIPDADTAYSALTNGGLRLVGTQFALKTCTASQILKAQATSGEWDCAADNNTTYNAGTGLSLVGTTFNNTGVLGVTASGALTSSGGQNPNIAFADGAVTGQFWQWDGDSWELASLPADGDSVVGNEVTNVTGSNSGLVRSGSGTAVSPYTLAVSVGNGLQLTSGNVAINSPTCSGTTKLQWNGTAFVCSTDVDTTNFSITDGSTTQSVAATDAITFVGNSSTKTTVTLGGTRQLTFGLDLTGASSGQVLTYNGTNLAWQSPTTYAPTSCGASSTYICQNGNTLGGAMTIGTNDAFILNFETGGNTAMTILTDGSVGIGTASPGEALDVNGNITMPATSSAAGVILQGNSRLLHTAGSGTTNAYFGVGSGNLTQTATFNTGIGAQALREITTGSFNTAVSANGLLNTTTGSLNTAMGMQSLLGNTTGSDNTALGHNAGYTGVSGAFANTTGAFNTFIGSLSGPGSATQLQNATAIGAYATVTQNNSLVLGCVSGVASCPATTSVGIANSAPGFLLHVGSASTTSGTSVARFQNAGGTCTVTPNTAGGITCTSDERAKKNIEAFTGAVDLLERINIKKYNMKSDKDGSIKQVGVIAQEVEDVLPGLVVTDSDGSKSFSYAGLTPILLQAIKEQQVQINQIKAGVWSGGVVSKDTTFKSQAIFEGPARFVGETSFKGDVAISGKVKLSKDQVNAVILPKGKKSIGVTFGGSYTSPPYITATPRDFLKGNQFRITNVTRTGFTIEVNEAQSKPVRFDWHAFSH